MLTALALLSSPALAQDDGLACRHHRWGRFEPGAWKLVRVITETLDKDGTITGTSTSDTRTVLVQKGPQFVELYVTVTVEVAGKTFDAEPETIVESFCGQRLDGEKDSLTFNKPKTATVTIEGRSVPCKVQQMQLEGPGVKQVSNVYFSDRIEPSVLKCESATTEPKTNKEISQSTTQVLALNMPFRVLTEMHTTAHLRTVHKHGKGMTVTTWVISPKVPGGTVAQWSKILDGDGNVVQRSTLELLDYGVESDEEIRTGLFGRKRVLRMFRSAQ
jgi:hypothetical protein